MSQAPSPARRSAPHGGRVDATGAVTVWLRWSVSHPRWGTEHIEVRRDGQVNYHLETPAHRQAQATQATLQLDTNTHARLQARMAHCKPCSLRSLRSAQGPDESRPQLWLDTPSMQCRVRLWFGEWMQQQALACTTLIGALRARLKAASSPLF
ncbi:MAG: hypothetical protein ACPGUV_07805 [Polyangiales bacterium]